MGRLENKPTADSAILGESFIGGELGGLGKMAKFINAGFIYLNCSWRYESFLR